MSEAVDWQDPSAPRSPRFNDWYRSRSGGLAQAQQVFLAGCGLPQAWADQPDWRVLETGFGLGLNFLATWQAWRSDPQAPGLLHYVSIEAYPVAASDLLQSVQSYPQLQTLAHELAGLWQDWEPGCHRLRFDAGRVLLTLCIGDVQALLPDLQGRMDTVFLDGFSPALNPQMWSLQTLKAVSRRCRQGTRVATWSVAHALQKNLSQCGFEIELKPGLPPKQQRLEALFSPMWTPRPSGPRLPAAWPGHASDCVVVGGGLAGASVAFALAQRGWRVRVLDQAPQPAAGASGLPAGLVVPHYSVDDAVISRLTRHGVSATWAAAAALLQADQDYARCGVRELDVQAWPDQANPHQSSRWHGQAGWVKPAALVRALLAHAGIEWCGNQAVQRLRRVGEHWQVLDPDAQLLAQAPLLVLCAGFATLGMLPQEQSLSLQALRGQVSWGLRRPTQADAFPPQPVNGCGNFIPNVPTDDGPAWFLGSSFVRDDTDTTPRMDEHIENLQRLQQLLPASAQALAPEFAAGSVRAFCATRCATSDRLPVVGPVDSEQHPGLWVSTAMGARGLSLAVLCGELLAALLHAEPLPLELRLAQTLLSTRRSLQRHAATPTPL